MSEFAGGERALVRQGRMAGESESAAQVLRERGVLEPLGPAFILGTGLGSIVDSVEDAIVVPYTDLPGFPRGNVSGHEGQLVIGLLENRPVAIMRGRSHYYENGDPRAMAGALETLSLLGAQIVVMTNSAGSIHPAWSPGSLVLISDHINFSGLNPLIGTTGDERFVPLSDAYDGPLRDRLRQAASAASIPHLHEGVYMWFSGPSFETPAEIRAAKLLGADLVGMSTVPEVILARRLTMRVAAVSVITNFATGVSGGDPSHAETKDIALQGSIALKRLLRAFMRVHDTAAAL